MPENADNELHKQDINENNNAIQETNVVEEITNKIHNEFSDSLYDSETNKDISTKQVNKKSTCGPTDKNKVTQQCFRYANNSAPTFSSPPQSPLVGLIFNPFGNNFGGECEMGERNSNNDRQHLWTSSNQDPIGTGAKKKIVKTQDKHTGYSNDPRYTHDRYRDNDSDRQKNFTSESTSSLDFYIEGEKMVSELCSFNDTSFIPKSDCYTQKENFKSTIKGEENAKPSSSSDLLLTALEKIVIHDQIPNQIVQLAIEACTDAENIAIAHHNRPCFKNIHSICAKTRSNVQKPDSAVANLHSQGVPWVIKNFIFSFVRILDGWKGVKELLCEKHDTFSRIENKYYSPNIRECFVQWQAVTKEMLTHIYKTFKCLDHGFTMEQKSFTHNYYSTNSPGPRSQSQTKFQTVKPHVNIARPINPSVQSFNAIQPPWIQNQNQQNNQSFHETSWSTRPSISYKKIPVIPVQASNNFFSVNDQNDMDIFQRAHYKETKPRQSWTITNVHDYRTLESSCQSDHRDIYAHLRYNIDAELGKTPGPSLNHNHNLNYDLLLRRELELKSKMVPLSHVEKTLVPNNDIRSCYLQRNNSCGDTKDENDFFASWGQIVQRETCDFVTNQDTQFPTNVLSIPNTSGPAQYHEKEEFHEISKVYMKPGSYKVPIKPDALTSFNINSPLSDVTYDSNVNEPLSNIKIKVPHSSVTLAPNPKYTLESWPCVMPRRSEDIFSEENKQAPRVGTSYLDVKHPDTMDIFNCLTSDRAWEAAKQSAPKLMDIIHDGSKSDTARLYDALGLNVNDEYLEQTAQDSWQISHLLPKSMTSLWDEDSSDKKNESIESENVIGSLEVDKESATDQKRTVKDIVLKSEQSTKDESNKKNSSIKKLAGNWYHPKKKKPLSVATIKKFEEMLNLISQMQEAKLIQNDVNFKMAPKFYDIVRYPIFLHDIETKLKNSYYTEQEQIVQDARRVFNNIRLYLKSYPDTTMKKNINKVSTSFEKLLIEDKAKSHDHRNENDKKIALEPKEQSEKLLLSKTNTSK